MNYNFKGVLLMIKTNFNFHKKFIENNEIINYISDAKGTLQLLLSKKGPGNDFLGWLDYDKYIDDFDIEKIKKIAQNLIKISLLNFHLIHLKMKLLENYF